MDSNEEEHIRQQALKSKTGIDSNLNILVQIIT